MKHIYSLQCKYTIAMFMQEMYSCINIQCLLILLSYLSFICVISLSLYIDFMSCESVIHGQEVSVCLVYWTVKLSVFGLYVIVGQKINLHVSMFMYYIKKCKYIIVKAS